MTTTSRWKTDHYREYHREQMKRLGQTPGTYRYKEYNREGLPGITRDISNRRLDLKQARRIVETKLQAAKALVGRLLGDINGNR